MNRTGRPSRSRAIARALRSCIALSALMLASAPAWASDYRGLISTMTVFFIVAPFALLNLLLTLVLAVQGSYAEEKVARRHGMIAAIGPAIGFLAMAFDQLERDAVILFFAANGLALLFAGIPLAIHNWQEQNAQDRQPPAA